MYRRMSGNRAMKPACQPGLEFAAGFCWNGLANAIMGDLLGWDRPGVRGGRVGENTTARAIYASAMKEGADSGRCGTTEMRWERAWKPDFPGS
jgi:hypothetical protein